MLRRLKLEMFDLVQGSRVMFEIRGCKLLFARPNAIGGACTEE